MVPGVGICVALDEIARACQRPRGQLRRSSRSPMLGDPEAVLFGVIREPLGEQPRAESGDAAADEPAGDGHIDATCPASSPTGRWGARCPSSGNRRFGSRPRRDVTSRWTALQARTDWRASRRSGHRSRVPRGRPVTESVDARRRFSRYARLRRGRWGCAICATPAAPTLPFRPLRRSCPAGSRRRRSAASDACATGTTPSRLRPARSRRRSTSRPGDRAGGTPPEAR